MLHEPEHAGLFEPNIEEIARIVTTWSDALLRRREPQRDHGRHAARATWASTSSTTTCTRRSRSRTAAAARARGPIAVSDRIEPFLPKPQIVRRDTADGPVFDLDYDRPQSIGRLRGFQGNYGVFVRSYAYILSLGGDGLQEASETAVLNANYLLARLKEHGVADQLPVAYDRLCMHEFVLSGAR
jgi:glycine dehydrogenase subunit 2